MKCAVAVDIGGTTIKYGLIGMDGSILYKSTRESGANAGASCLMEKVKQIVHELIGYNPQFEIAGIGIASAGQIDHVKGSVIFATSNIPEYTGMEIKSIIENEFGLKAFVENDVNAAALGEAWIGAGAGFSGIFCITIGTGVGGGIVRDGRIEHGISGSAGEIGHLIIKFDGLPCNCGNRGCLEQYASARALVRDITERLKMGAISRISLSAGSINAQMIFDAARQGDQLANQVVDDFVIYLGIGLVSLIHTFNPDIVIIGGGISDAGEFLTDKVNDFVKTHVMPSFLDKLKIVPAILGNNAGIIGAAKLVFEESL